MNVAYIRVSTVEQNEERQVKALEGKEIDKWYIEKVSAKDTNRPKLQEMLDYVREGDKVYIKDFSRLARSTKDLLEIIDYLEEKGVSLISLNENLDTSTPVGKLLVTMIGAINEFERNNLLERQKEGIAIAKEKGIYKGRQPLKIKENKFKDLYEEMEKGYITKIEMAEKLGISRSTLYRRIGDYEKELEEEKTKN
jgi:DNA invertase Pin-like site-specific DNA recombinase